MEADVLEMSLDAFGCDAFFTMFSEPQKGAHQQKLFCLFEVLLQACNSEGFEEAMQSEPEGVRDFISRMVFVGKAIAVLFSTRTVHLKAKAADLAELYNYKGKQDFELSIKLMLGQNQMLSSAVDQILKTAGADAKYGHLPQQHIEQLTQALEMDTWPSCLLEATQAWAKLKSQLRSGSTDELREKLVKVALVKATNHADLLKNPAACEPLANALSILQSEEGCLDHLHRLRQWMKENSTLLKTGQTKAYFEQLARSAEDFNPGDGAEALPLELLKQFPSKVSILEEPIDGRRLLGYDFAVKNTDHFIVSE